jgi:hypothetical protein
LTSPKSSSFTTSRSPPLRAEHDIGGLDVAMDQANGMRFGQRSARHRQDAQHSACGLRPADGDYPLQVRAVEQLHRIVEDAVVGSAVVEDGDGIGVRQARGQLDFPLEATQLKLAGPIESQQFERRGSSHHAMAGPVDLAHAALADLLLEHVLAQPTGFADLDPESVDDPRDDRARDDDEPPHHSSCGRQPGIRARIERAPSETAVGSRDEDRRQPDQRDADHGGNDDRATRRRRDQRSANGEHQRDAA